MKTSIIAMMACAVLVGVAVAGEHPKETAAGAGGGALDGKVFAAQLVKSGEKDGDKDQLTFKRGQILGEAGDKRRPPGEEARYRRGGPPCESRDPS
jgi:hypothetical protein